MRESYVRYNWRIIGLEIAAGLEWRTGSESAKELWAKLRAAIAPVLAECPSTEAEDMTLEVEEALKSVFPDRAYFIEVSDGDEKWTQVYDPRGFLKARCDCPCTQKPKRVNCPICGKATKGGHERDSTDWCWCRAGDE